MLTDFANRPGSTLSTDDISVDTNTAVTPPESVLPDLEEGHNDSTHDEIYPGSYIAPDPNFTYMIRSVRSRDYLTLLKGEIMLAPTDSLGAQHWECVGMDGWLCFRNVASYNFLGRDGSWSICCNVPVNREWEKFHVLSRAEGGFVMLMTHWGKLRPVDFRSDQSGDKLAMVEVGSNNGVLWEFVKV